MGMAVNDHDITWAAGLFEGEGSIDIKKSRGYEYLRLQLASTDEDIIRKFHYIVGLGSVFGPYGPYKTGLKQQWRWHISNKKADSVLSCLLPYLGDRRTAKALEIRKYFDR
jgi:hypothetical protein